MAGAAGAPTDGKANLLSFLAGFSPLAFAISAFSAAVSWGAVRNFSIGVEFFLSPLAAFITSSLLFTLPPVALSTVFMASLPSLGASFGISLAVGALGALVGSIFLAW